jgi:hypothetical protein
MLVIGSCVVPRKKIWKDKKATVVKAIEPKGTWEIKFDDGVYRGEFKSAQLKHLKDEPPAASLLLEGNKSDNDSSDNNNKDDDDNDDDDSMEEEVVNEEDVGSIGNGSHESVGEDGTDEFDADPNGGVDNNDDEDDGCLESSSDNSGSDDEDDNTPANDDPEAEGIIPPDDSVHLLAETMMKSSAKRVKLRMRTNARSLLTKRALS